jgi:hypothetical protein
MDLGAVFGRDSSRWRYPLTSWLAKPSAASMPATMPVELFLAAPASADYGGRDPDQSAFP